MLKTGKSCVMSMRIRAGSSRILDTHSSKTTVCHKTMLGWSASRKLKD